jgi:hypothetical protein
MEIKLTPLSGRGAKREIKFRIHDDEVPALERKAHCHGFPSINALAAQATRQYGEHNSAKLSSQMGEAAMVLHDLRVAASRPTSQVTPAQVKSMIRTWELLCDALVDQLRSRT